LKSTIIIFVLAFAALGLLLGFAEVFDILPGPVESGNNFTVNLEEELHIETRN
jgi:hypothetical protein